MLTPQRGRQGKSTQRQQAQAATQTSQVPLEKQTQRPVQEMRKPQVQESQRPARRGPRGTLTRALLEQPVRKQEAAGTATR
jgi:hypothetical protein